MTSTKYIGMDVHKETVNAGGESTNFKSLSVPALVLGDLPLSLVCSA
jgi:hypothetical protein